MDISVSKNTLILDLAIGPVACQKDSPVSPMQPEAASVATARLGSEGISPNFPQVHQLTKHGDENKNSCVGGFGYAYVTTNMGLPF